jgi:two-component system, NarL family, nitrate/nitrite response regulator NarL
VGGVITVAIVDDHPAIVAGVTSWYAQADPPIRILAAGGDLATVWTEPGRSADVVVLDLHLAGDAEPVFPALRALVDAGRQVIVYSMREDSGTVLTAIDLGAYTYLTKAEGGRHLVAATHAAAESRPYTPPALAGAMVTDRRPSAPHLAARETQVLLEWFQSDSKSMVAQKLKLSPSTVAGYLDRIRIKYANVGRPAATKAALVARAIQDGLIAASDL